MHFPADRQDYRADPDWQGDLTGLQFTPFTAEAVPRAGLVQFQLVYVDHVRRVDRIGPAEVLVMAQEGEG